MKKILFMACAILVGGFAAQAQEDSDMVGTSTTKTIVKKETTPAVETTTKKVVVEKTAPRADEMDGTNSDAPTNMERVLEERKARAATIRAEKKKQNKKRISTKKTGVKKSKAKVVTKEMLEAEKIEKAKKATKTDN